MPEYTVTIHRKQTFIVKADSPEQAGWLCLDEEWSCIDDEIVEIGVLSAGGAERPPLPYYPDDLIAIPKESKA